MCDVLSGLRGLWPEDLADGVLTITGEKRAEAERKGRDYRFVERSYGTFSRSFALPDWIDASKIKASIADGVLKVSAPRRPKREPQKIEVQPAV